MVISFVVFYGDFQGIPRDDSDDEWNGHIRLEYGVRPRGLLREIRPRLDEGLDIDGLVQHPFHMYDNIAGGMLADTNGDGGTTGDDTDSDDNTPGIEVTCTPPMQSRIVSASSFFMSCVSLSRELV